MSINNPLEIPHRPYAIFPPANLMLPDGIFVINFGIHSIETHLNNSSNIDLKKVKIYIEGFSDFNIINFSRVVLVGDIPAKAKTPVRFRADFSNASPSTSLVSFIIETEGYQYKRIIKKIFITKFVYNVENHEVKIFTPQGELEVKVHRAIYGPRCHLKNQRKERRFTMLPTELTYKWLPNQPFLGRHSSLPYEDPWWKPLVALAAFIVLLVVAGLVDWLSDGSFEGPNEVVVNLSGGDVPPQPGSDGPFDRPMPDQECCKEIIDRIPEKNDDISVGPSATGDGDTVERIAYGLAGPLAGIIGGLVDTFDPIYRGRENTNPRDIELTEREQIDCKLTYPEPVDLGKPFAIEAEWKYTRKTNIRILEYEVKETNNHLHYVEKYEVVAPSEHDRRDGPLEVKVRFHKPDREFFKGNELYVFGVLVSAYGAVRHFRLNDDGMKLDDKANDGWFTGGYYFDTKRYRARKGEDPSDLDLTGMWYLFIFSQDVNTALEGLDPVKAAQHIGGLILTPQIKLNFDEPCSLEYDAIIHVY